MSKLNLPEKPKFVENITAFQKILAGVSGSCFLVAAITLLPFIESHFFTTPAAVAELVLLRLRLAEISLVCAAPVGVPQIWKMLGWLVKFYEFYRDFKKQHPGEDLLD
jgi:hypothetical protein